MIILQTKSGISEIESIRYFHVMRTGYKSKRLYAFLPVQDVKEANCIKFQSITGKNILMGNLPTETVMEIVQEAFANNKLDLSHIQRIIEDAADIPKSDVYLAYETDILSYCTPFSPFDAFPQQQVLWVDKKRKTLDMISPICLGCSDNSVFDDDDDDEWEEEIEEWDDDEE
ncbi:MAG: hypothetical protein IJ079_02585 [Lachnospiraceae bacterium]|nr:hypothetical protein [Lachnospiraceae bacterium]